MIRKSIPTEIRPASIGHPAVRQITGNHDAGRMAFGIAASRFNDRITHRLLQTTVDSLTYYGAVARNITVVWVPGSFEIGSVLEELANSKQFNSLIALGAVIQGETPHADLISSEVTRSISDISKRHGVPVIDGVIITHTMEQAEARSISGSEGRGWYVARAAIEMARVFERLKA